LWKEKVAIETRNNRLKKKIDILDRMDRKKKGREKID
jgi:hypothetical protein